MVWSSDVDHKHILVINKPAHIQLPAFVFTAYTWELQFLRRVSERWTMATNGAAVVEDRVGITFGVELYVPWDAPEAIVDISSAGVVPLRHIPDVIGLVGRREGAAECRVLQGRDVRSV